MLNAEDGCGVTTVEGDIVRTPSTGDEVDERPKRGRDRPAGHDCHGGVLRASGRRSSRFREIFEFGTPASDFASLTVATPDPRRARVLTRWR